MTGVSCSPEAGPLQWATVAERKPAKNAMQNPPKSTTAIGKTSKGLARIGALVKKA
jgi:hypothetical protein